MNKTRKINYACLLLMIALSSCYYDHEELLYPDSNNCTPAVNPSFTTDVLPVLEARCNNCHSGAFASGGIKLDTYQNVMPYVTDGSLLGSIKHTSGFSAMPKNGSKLSACDIQKIEDWINAGSPQN